MNPRKDEAFNKALAGVCDTYKCVAWLEGGVGGGGYELILVSLNDDGGSELAKATLGPLPNFTVTSLKVTSPEVPHSGVPYYPQPNGGMKPGDVLRFFDFVYYVDGEDGLEFLDMWARMDTDPGACFGETSIPEGSIVTVLREKRGVLTPCVEVEVELRKRKRKLWVVKKQLVNSSVNTEFFKSKP